jgi:3-dehydroquinate synthase/2-deoxy-scyllo-inosose synthase
MEFNNLIIGPHKIPYYIGKKCFDEIAANILALNPDRLYIITDDNIEKIYLNDFLHSFPSNIRINKFIIPSGEKNKTISTVTDLIEKILKNGVTRQSIIIPLGGGVIGNIAGLTAALLYRGIRFIHMPTTLLAMHDSVTSMKQAVNSCNAKNIIGTFYPPTAIYIDMDVLSSLSQRHIHSGIYELVKNALIFGGEYYYTMKDVLSHGYDENNFSTIIKLGIKAKQQLLRKDKFEKKEAIIFEYGHTIGHAFELLKSPNITHGESIAIGMMYAGFISHELGYLPTAKLENHNQLIQSVNNLTIPEIEYNKIIKIIQNDNKRGYIESEQAIPMLLLNKIGSFVGNIENNYLTRIERNVIYKVLTSKIT